METNQTKKTDIFLIDPRNVVVIEGFNVRRDFEIDELKEQIKDKGVLNPITVIPFKDSETGIEKYRLVDGERRLRATLKAIEEGVEINRIKAIYLNRKTKEEDLFIEQVMRNEGKNFTEYEYGTMFLRFKDNYGYTQTEIADKFKRLPGFVSRCLALMDVAPEIQEKLEKNEISASTVRSIISTYSDDEDAQVAAVTTAVENAKLEGKKTAKGKDLDVNVKEKQEAKKIVKSLYSIIEKVKEVSQDEDCVTVDLCELLIELEETGSLEKAILNIKNREI